MEFGKMNCPVDGKGVRESTEYMKRDDLDYGNLLESH